MEGLELLICKNNTYTTHTPLYLKKKFFTYIMPVASDALRIPNGPY